MAFITPCLYIQSSKQFYSTKKVVEFSRTKKECKLECGINYLQNRMEWDTMQCDIMCGLVYYLISLIIF